MIRRLWAMIARSGRALGDLLVSGQGGLGVAFITAGVWVNWGVGWAGIVLGGFILLGAFFGGGA